MVKYLFLIFMFFGLIFVLWIAKEVWNKGK
jgi:hypothetical protein